MIAATRRWFRRNRTNLLIGAGVITAGYVAGQYVLNKIQEARQRMSEERTAKEKYESHDVLIWNGRLTGSLIAFDGDSNRIKRIAPIQSLLSSLPSERRLLARCQSNKLQSSYNKSGKRGCGDWEDRRQLLQNCHLVLPASRTMPAYKAAAMCMPARWQAAV